MWLVPLLSLCWQWVVAVDITYGPINCCLPSCQKPFFSSSLNTDCLLGCFYLSRCSVKQTLLAIQHDSSSVGWTSRDSGWCSEGRIPSVRAGADTSPTGGLTHLKQCYSCLCLIKLDGSCIRSKITVLDKSVINHEGFWCNVWSWHWL